MISAVIPSTLKKIFKNSHVFALAANQEVSFDANARSNWNVMFGIRRY